jgi:hypothetical protein
METLDKRWEERGRWAMRLALRLRPWPLSGEGADLDTSSDWAAIERIYTAWLYLVTGVENLRIQYYAREAGDGQQAPSSGSLRPLVLRSDSPAEYVIQLLDGISARARWDLMSQAARLVWELEGSPPAPATELSES